MKTVIVEDEFHCKEGLKNLIEEFCEGLVICGEATSVDEAISVIQYHQPDLVFMDIEIIDGTGFDVILGLANPDFHLIFTTAFDHYAIRAIRFNALDYLLKPIDLDELRDAVEKAKSWNDQKNRNKNLEYLITNLKAEQNENPVITLSTSNSFEYVRVSQIIRCEAQGAYTKFFIKRRQPILVSRILKEFEGLLNEHGFFRVHQSHLVNLKEVEKYIKTDGGYVLLNDQTKLGVARSKRENFFEAMKKHRGIRY